MLYQSFLPGDPAHGYLAWFSPLIGFLSVAALALVPLALAARPAARLVEAALPERSPRPAWEVCRLASAAAAFLLVQESLERWLSSGDVRLASFGPATALLLALVLTIAAAAVVALERSIAKLAADRAPAPAYAPALPAWAATLAAPARPRPLALHAGLRAPPLLG